MLGRLGALHVLRDGDEQLRRLRLDLRDLRVLLLLLHELLGVLLFGGLLLHGVLALFLELVRVLELRDLDVEVRVVPLEDLHALDVLELFELRALLVLRLFRLGKAAPLLARFLVDLVEAEVRVLLAQERLVVLAEQDVRAVRLLGLVVQLRRLLDDLRLLALLAALQLRRAGRRKLHVRLLVLADAVREERVVLPVLLTDQREIVLAELVHLLVELGRPLRKINDEVPVHALHQPEW